MKHLATFQEATAEDLEEMLELLETKPVLYVWVDFLLLWVEGKENVDKSLGSVLNWMRTYHDPY